MPETVELLREQAELINLCFFEEKLNLGIGVWDKMTCLDNKENYYTLIPYLL